MKSSHAEDPASGVSPRIGGSVERPASWRGWATAAFPVALLASISVWSLADSLGVPWPGVAWSAVPASLEVLGFSGHAGEWELTAKLARKGDTRELSGPLKLTHVGWCSQDGPEVKTGEINITMARLTSSIDVRLRVDDAECTFQNRLTDVYAGTLHCADKRPAPLSLWLR